jgi:dihydropteroate synthase
MNTEQTIIRCGEQMLTLPAAHHPSPAPVVMGVLNVTPDSFYAASRCTNADAIAARVHQILSEGGGIVDVGAYSTRPGAADVPESVENQRLSEAMEIIRTKFPQAIVSIDTFRSGTVKAIVERFGDVIVNDASGGDADEQMFATVAELHLPYILMHTRGTPQTMQALTQYDDLMGDLTLWFSERIRRLRALGVADIILDPGFGFAKTTEQNFELLAHLSELGMFELPILVGVSRKRMIYQTLQTSPEKALNGTTVLNTLALLQGASILRVHDVGAAVEAVRLWQAVACK